MFSIAPVRRWARAAARTTFISLEVCRSQPISPMWPHLIPLSSTPTSTWPPRGVLTWSAGERIGMRAARFHPAQLERKPSLMLAEGRMHSFAAKPSDGSVAVNVGREGIVCLVLLGHLVVAVGDGPDRLI